MSLPNHETPKRLWRAATAALAEDRRMLAGAMAFALASLIVYRVVLYFGLAR